MKPWIRRTLIGATAVLALGAAGAGYAVYRGHAKMDREVPLATRSYSMRSDSAAVERGRYLYQSRGCTDCHGDDAGGRTFIDDPKSGMRVAGPNLTPHADSAAAAYRAEDWDRAIRHGVKRDGRPAMVMPSEDYARWTDDDLAALVTYLRQVPPVAGGAAVVELPLPVIALYGLGQIEDAADKIDHDLPPQPPVPEAVTIEHGRYVGQTCTGCHGPTLAGGRVPGSPPEWPPAAKLAAGDGSAMPRYADAAAFRTMMRGGKRPDGSAIAVMPFGPLSQMSDVDLDALYVYLRSLPVAP